MRVTAVEAFPLRYPEPHDSGRPRCVTLVRVRADDGQEGWGECIAQWPEAALAVVPIVERGLAELLIGADPLRIGALWDRMRAHASWYGDGGIATFAISAIDMALWDLKGKALGVPVYELLGGRRVERVRACASVIFDTVDLGATREEFAAYRERGFTAVKGGWGRSPEVAFGLDPVRDVAVVRTVREAVGPDVGVAIDVGTHVRWSAGHAIEMARRFAEYDLLWLEEPLAHDDLEGHRRLRAATTTPIASGERGWTVAGFHALIAAGVLDIVMPDPGRAEGLTGFKAIVDDAARAGLRFTPHSWSSAVNTAAALHAFVASPNGVVFELKPHPSPMQHELVAEPFEQRDGFVIVPERPGLGVEIDARALERYRWA